MDKQVLETKSAEITAMMKACQDEAIRLRIPPEKFSSILLLANAHMINWDQKEVSEDEIIEEAMRTYREIILLSKEIKNP